MPLDQKLYKSAADVSKAGFWFALFTMLTILIRFYFEVEEGREHVSEHGPVNERVLSQSYRVIMDYIIVAFSIILVAVPEGLALAVIIAVAA